jgi:hypothetical protein
VEKTLEQKYIEVLEENISLRKTIESLTAIRVPSVWTEPTVETYNWFEVTNMPKIPTQVTTTNCTIPEYSFKCNNCTCEK